MFSLFEKILGPELDGFPRALDPAPWRSGECSAPPKGLRCGAPTRR